MNIDELFEKYPNNIIGFRINKATKILDVWLSNDWDIIDLPENCTIKKQKDDEELNRAYYILYSDVHNFNWLFTIISELIEHNLDNERKQELFVQKMGELKSLFVSLSYDELKQLQIDSPISFKSEPLKMDIDTPISSKEKKKNK